MDRGVIANVENTAGLGTLSRLPLEVLLIVLEWLCKIDPVTFLGILPQTSRPLRALASRAITKGAGQDVRRAFEDFQFQPEALSFETYTGMANAIMRLGRGFNPKVRIETIKQWLLPLSESRIDDLIKLGFDDVAREVLKQILTPEVMLPDDDGFNPTPLHIACEYKSVTLTRLLLTKGRDFEILGDMLMRLVQGGPAPLSMACFTSNANKRPPLLELVSMLLDAGKEAFATDAGYSAFIDKGCWSYDRTALMELCCDRDVDPADSIAIMNELVRRGATFDQVDKDDKPAFQHACENGRLELAEALLALPPVDVPGEKPMVVDVTSTNEDGDTYLFTAHSRCMPMLIKRGLKVNATNKYDVTPLLRTASGPVYLRTDRPDLEHRAHILIGAGAEVDATNTVGQTALIVACREFHVEVAGLIRVLLEAGADPTVEDNLGHDAIDHLEPDRWRYATAATLIEEMEEIIRTRGAR